MGQEPFSTNGIGFLLILEWFWQFKHIQVWESNSNWYWSFFESQFQIISGSQKVVPNVPLLKNQNPLLSSQISIKVHKAIYS